MGMIAARKARKILQNVQNLLAIEFLCAVQGVHLSAQDKRVNLQKFPLGKGTSRIFDCITNFKVETERKTLFPFQKMQDDEYLQAKVQMMQEFISHGKVLQALSSEFVKL
jgi:histidine ammonia-lyase